jgi:hypothetical protein
MRTERVAVVPECAECVVDGGERHPVKALSEKHVVTISAASHWLREARVRKLLPAKEAQNAR